ncbi:hypothetical protein ACIFOT_26895 [Neobacillus sp. NRS-1170]|uniref:hypothetical protein n=1 Tax=Neobacillus sp. NRS-1170 TaxID=3233898 RepID=UPI003D2BEC11
MNKAQSQIPKGKLDLYDKLIETIPNIERKGVTSPYTSLNGHMFTYLSKDGVLGIRLPKDKREAFLHEYNTVLYEQHGSTLKEYVTVPDYLLEKAEELKKYLEISYEYVKGLKTNPMLGICFG